MKYMLLIYSNEAAMQTVSEAESSQMIAAYRRLHRGDEPSRRPARRRSAATDRSATTVRVANGKTKVLNGPYAETQGAARRLLHDRGARSRRRAVLGGALPRRASHGTIEVRPIWTM